MNPQRPNVEVMLKLFAGIESRDERKVFGCVQPDVQFHWPPSLPYAGVFKGLASNGGPWATAWTPLQPTPIERSMSPRVVAASGNEVAILWRQRGLAPAGDRIDTEVLGLYLLREGKLARAQMFYFDPVGVAHFLINAAKAADLTTA